MDPILQQLQNEIGGSLNGLNSAQTQLVPSASSEKWSIQQIVQHLCLTYAFTETAFNARLAKGTPTGAKPTLQQHIGQYFLTTLGIFPTGRKAPERVTPPQIASPVCGSDLTHYSGEHLARIDKLFNQAEALFGRGRCISHMSLGPLSIHQWRRFHLVHGRHHIKQIRAIRVAHHL
ncbi:MAG TPA: hypothetical protein VIX42_01025 [Edaphobacter sp.]